MNDNRRARVLENIASPYGLAVASCGLFVVACVFPPAMYTYYMHEPDFMFLAPETILFYTLCVAAFLVGVWFLDWVFPSPSFVEHKFEARFSPAVFLLIPLLLCTALTMLSCVLLVKNNPLVIPILLARQGGLLKVDDGSGLQLEGTLNVTVLFLTGIVWWVVWRVREFGVQGRGKRMVKFALAFAVLIEFVSSSLNLVRHPLTVVITGLTVVYLLQKISVRQLNWRVIRRTAFVFVFGGAFFFFLVSWIRGGLGGGDQAEAFVGYTIASYNRMAALLQGRLGFEFPGRGIYFSNFLSFNHTFNRIIPFAKVMNVPDYFDWWRSSFSSVGRAGLDGSLIFFGAFGELYLDIGWFAPLYVFGYGLLYGLVWRWMKEGKVAGILLYPYFAYCILFWFSTNGLFDQDVVALIIDAIIIGAYEYLFVSRSKLLVAVSQAD